MFPDTLITSAHTLYTHTHTHTHTHTQIHTYKLSVNMRSITPAHTLFAPWREHFNSTRNTGWCTWSHCSCPSLNTHCGTSCSLGCHAPRVILSHWLSAHWNVQHWTQNLFPAGLTDWVKFGAMNHHSTKSCVWLYSQWGLLTRRQRTTVKSPHTDEADDDGSRSLAPFS